MNVGELIEYLQQFDKELPVEIDVNAGEYIYDLRANASEFGGSQFEPLKVLRFYA